MNSSCQAGTFLCFIKFKDCFDGRIQLAEAWIDEM